MTTRVLEAMELPVAECLMKCGRALDHCAPEEQADPRI